MSKGLLNFNFDTLDNITRALSLNSPLVKTILLGAGGYYAGKKMTPIVSRLLSPKLPQLSAVMPGYGAYGYDDMPLEEQNSLAHNIGLITALTMATPTLVHNFDIHSPWLGYKKFPEKESYNKFINGIKGWFNKNSSAFDIMDPMQAIPLSTARETIMNHPTLTPMTKATSLSILNTFPEQSQITGKSLIDRAVSSGIDFALGGAAGAIAAHAIGLPNPYATALITGTLNTII